MPLSPRSCIRGMHVHVDPPQGAIPKSGRRSGKGGNPGTELNGRREQSPRRLRSSTGRPPGRNLQKGTSPRVERPERKQFLEGRTRRAESPGGDPPKRGDSLEGELRKGRKSWKETRHGEDVLCGEWEGDGIHIPYISLLFCALTPGAVRAFVFFVGLSARFQME